MVPFMISARLSRILSIFALSGASVLAAAAPAAAQGGPIALGEPIAGLVTAERGDSWTIELRQGMFLRIDLTRERTSSLNPKSRWSARAGASSPARAPPPAPARCGSPSAACRAAAATRSSRARSRAGWAGATP
jgi:hypothetical protein